jgi:hypothetical protein
MTHCGPGMAISTEKRGVSPQNYKPSEDRAHYATPALTRFDDQANYGGLTHSLDVFYSFLSKRQSNKHL